jgi:hypothetical protein
MLLLPEFRLSSVSNPVVENPLGPLAQLLGTWNGTGFNQIWRPFSQPGQDRFLELNETREILSFEAIPGDIPNRGLLQPDINLHGVRYLQQIQDAHVMGPNGHGVGIHLEPGLWLSIPTTANPAEPPSVARLANIPHGTAFVAQGTATVIPGAPSFFVTDISPFPIGQPGNAHRFPEQDLAAPTQFRTAPGDIPDLVQAIIDDPNRLLAAAATGKNITATTVLNVSTSPIHPPMPGGGTNNIAFLVGGSGGPNAQAAAVSATFWIETIVAGDGTQTLQLQYSQRVLLNFNGLSWPHVSVATLVKQ